MNKRLKALTLSSALVLSLLSGCGKKNEEKTTTTEAAKYEVNLTEDAMLNDDTTDITVMKDGMVQSDLTGEWISPEENKLRPVTFMINNIVDAMPQDGVEAADVVYEMLEEGGITRLMCVYHHKSYVGLEKIGPNRSARHYYDRKAMEHDAVFTHWGQSIFAQEDFDTMADLDQVDFNGKDGAYGYRSDDRVAPHNAYTSGDRVDQAIEADGFDKTVKDDFKKMFAFNTKDTDLADGKTANIVRTEFQEGRQTYFEYDASTKLYKRYQYGGPQVDRSTGNQLAFKNVLVQFCEHSPQPGGEAAGCINIEWVGSGDGYYATNGKIIPIKWEKTSADSVTRFYTTDGEVLKMNQGKTFVSVMQSDNVSGCKFE